MEEWKQRLRQAREAKGLNKTEFARAVGVSNPTVTDWEKSVADGGIKEISGVKLTKAAEVLGVSPAWLLHGVEVYGEPRPPAEVPPGFMRVEAVEEDDPRLVQIPKVKLQLSAGISGFGVEPEYYDGTTTTVPLDWIKRNGFSRDKLLAFYVTGESMETTFSDGDLVIVNTADTKPVSGDVFAVNHEGEPAIKRLVKDFGRWWLVSDNSDQRKYHRVSLQDDTSKIIGKIVRAEKVRF